MFRDAVAATMESSLPAEQVSDDRLSRRTAIQSAAKDFQDLITGVIALDRSFGEDNLGARKALSKWTPPLSEWVQVAKNNIQRLGADLMDSMEA